MNYKHLGKYHYIYRLSIGGDWKAHVEKLPIAYSNKNYIYVITPGSDELTRIDISDRSRFFEKIDDTTMIRLVDSEQRRINRIINRYSVSPAFYYFLIDNPDELTEFASKITSTYLVEKQLLIKKDELLNDISRMRNQLSMKEKELETVKSNLNSYYGKKNCDAMSEDLIKSGAVKL